MNRRFFPWASASTLPLLVSGALASLVCTPQARAQDDTTFKAQAAQEKARKRVEGQLLVRWSGAGAPPGLGRGVPMAQRRQAQQSLRSRLSAALPGTRVSRHFDAGGWSLIRLPKGLSTEEGQERLSQTLGAENVVPNYKRQANAIPNDPAYSQQWQWPKITAPDAWNYSTGTTNVVVAVLDTGVDLTHPDLQANLWKNTGEIPNNGLDDDANGYTDDVYGFNGVEGQRALPPEDDNGHGTHCAGLIGAKGNNGLQVTGTAWNVKIMSLKFLDRNSSGDDAGAIACLEYAIKMKQRGVNLRVISNSWSGSLDSPALKAQFQLAENAGILNVCASGNGGSGRNIDVNPTYPASYTFNSFLTVGASTSDDTRASFSNYGPQSVDLVAPGENILSLARGGGQTTMSGSSMATPIVAGAAALIASREPGLSALQIKGRLMVTVDQFPALNGQVATGGRLNLFRAVANATMRIYGTVYRDQVTSTGTTKVPLTGAVVKINGRITSTDGNGRYIIKELPAGRYTIAPSMTGYTFTQVVTSLPRPRGETGAPSALVDFTAQTAPSTFYTITGRAVNASGTPIPKVAIYIVGIPNPVTITNSTGGYQIRDRAAGSYRLQAYSPGYTWTASPISISLPRSRSVDPRAPHGTIDFFGKAPDTAAPRVTITTPANGVNRSPGALTATGTASDETGIAELYFQLTRTTGSTINFYDWTNMAWTANASAPGIKGIQKVSGTNLNWSYPLPNLIAASYSLRVSGADVLGRASQGEADAVSSWQVVNPTTSTPSAPSGASSYGSGGSS